MGWRARTWLVGLLIALVLGAGAWWWLAPPEAAVATEDAHGLPEGPAEEDAAALAARGMARAPPVATVRTSRGLVVGEVRKAGEPAAARVVAFETDRGEFAGRPFQGQVAMVPPADGAAPAPVAETAAGPDGAFRLDLPAPGTYVLVATGDGRGRDEVTVRTAGARVASRIDLRGGTERLSGRAVHADGRPFRGQVVVEPLGLEGPSALVFGAVATDEEGRFAVADLEAGLHTVAAFVPGRWRAQSRTVTVPAAGEVTLVVDEGTREVTGRVVDDKDGRPVGGAVVLTAAWSSGDVQRLDGRAVADGDGRFTVRASVLRSSWRVEAAGFAPLAAWRTPPPEGTSLELRLQRLARLSGRVTADGDGAPVPGVTVYALVGNEDGAEGTTDAEGRYAISGVRPGDVTVFAWGSGWCSPDLEAAQAQGFNPLSTTIPPDGAVVVDLVVRRAARATGRVTDAADAPAAGAQVTANRVVPGGNPSPYLAHVALVRGVATDAEGRFVVDTLLPGVSWRFEATAPASSPAQSPPIRAEVATPIVVDLKLGAPRWADVDVVEKESGAPVAGVQVQAHQQVTDGNWKSLGPAVAGAGGRARLGPLPPGPFLLWAWGDGYELQEQPTVGGPEGSTSDVQAKLVMTRTRFVEGVVRYADGQPAVGVIVRVTAPDWDTSDSVGDDGRFRLQSPATGTTVEVTAQQDWEGEVLARTRTAPGGPAVTLTVPGTKPPRFVVRVTDPEGKAVPHAQVFFLVPGADSSWESLTDGRLELAQPRADAHLLVFGARSDGGPLPLGMTIAGPIDAKAAEFEVGLVPELRIEGVVRTADGRPVRGVLLRTRPKGLPAPFENWTGEIGTTRTDDAGRFRIGGLCAGTFEIRVDAADRGGRTEPVEAKAGTADLVITLGEGAEAVLTVVGPDGQPVTGALVRARTQGQRWLSTETDGAGAARLRGLDRAAKYRLEVTPGETRLDLIPVVREAWAPRDEVIEVPPAFTIEGVVRDRAGAAILETWVDAVVNGNILQRARCTREGAFRMTRLAAGSYRLVARTQDPPRASRAVTVAAGSRDVALVLDAALPLAVRLEGWEAPEGGQWTALWDEETGTTTDWVEIPADGRLRVEGLHPEARYSVYVVQEGPGDESAPGPTRVGWKSGVRGDAGEVSVPMEPGATIGVRVILPPGVTGANVWATDGVVRREAWMPEPTRGRVTGLHAGSWTVKAQASSAQGAFAAEARVEAGGSVELDLKAVR